MGKGIRICGGLFGGRTLETPRGLQTRPTSSRAREALFNILGRRVEDARVADCFAGSGALGFEALSRGCATVTFFEANREALDSLHRNATTLGVGDQVHVVAGRLPASLRPSRRFDLFFLDPPWDKGLGLRVLESVVTRGLACAGAEAVLEERQGNVREDDLGQTSWVLCDQRTYGDTELSFLRFVDS